LFFNDFHVYDGKDHSGASAPSLLARGEVKTVDASPALVPLSLPGREQP
jgi:hypothetical protein